MVETSFHRDTNRSCLFQVNVDETEQELNFLAFKVHVPLLLEVRCEFGFGRG